MKQDTKITVPSQIRLVDDTGRPVEVQLSQGSLDEARGIGYQAGREETGFTYIINGRLSRTPAMFCNNLIKKLRSQAPFINKYSSMIQELVDIQARLYAITLAKVSTALSDLLYEGYSEKNIKHVTDKDLQNFVLKVLPSEKQSTILQQSLERAFWAGWLEGSGAIRAWQKVMGV